MIVSQYFQAFRDKDLSALRGLFATNVVLQDPNVGRIQGIDEVHRIYEEMFTKNEFEIEVKRQYRHKNEKSYAVEFCLAITSMEGNKSIIEGIDLIEICDGKISSVRAYLDIYRQ